MKVDRILSRNDVGDGGAGGGRFFGSWLGGGSFGRHGCCKFPARCGGRCGGVEELIDIFSTELMVIRLFLRPLVCEV